MTGDDEEQRRLSGDARGALARRRTLVRALTGGGVIFLAILALVEVAGLSMPGLRAALILGLAVCGTFAILLDARRICPGCGALYGYQLRLVNADKCRTCGADLRQMSK